MATSLTSILGSEIRVNIQPLTLDRSYTGFAGADGLTSMDLGTRGRSITVQGTIRKATRALLYSELDDIYQSLRSGGDYTYDGQTYSSVVLESLRLRPGPQGKTIRTVASGDVIVQFVCRLRSLS